MEATGSNPVEPTNMRKTEVDTRQKPLEIDDEISRAPIMWIERRVKDKIVRYLGRVVTLEDPPEGEFPFRIYDNQTKREIKLATDEERANAYRAKILPVPIELEGK